MAEGESETDVDYELCYLNELFMRFYAIYIGCEAFECEMWIEFLKENSADFDIFLEKFISINSIKNSDDVRNF